MALVWLTAARHKETFSRLRRTGYYWTWIAYFALFAVSYFYSDNKPEALFDTVGKLSFVLLPFLVGAGFTLTKPAVGRILLAFVGGLITTGLFCLFQAWTRYHTSGNPDSFFYHELVRGLDANAVYMAWYVVTGIAGLLLFPWQRAEMPKIVQYRWPAVIFLFAFLLLLASRLLILYCVVVVLPAFLFNVLSRRNNRAALIGAVVVMVVGLGLLFRTDNPVRDRFGEIMHPDLSTVTREHYHSVEPEWNNLTARLFIWRIGIENVRVHNLWLYGAGNGDVHRLQNSRIAYHGLLGMEDDAPVHGSLYNINLHNMYLQTLIAIGLPGVLCLVLIVLLPLFTARISEWGLLTVVFTIGSGLFLLQESALQTQAGVVFFSFFSVVFWHGVKKRSYGRKTLQERVIKN